MGARIPLLVRGLAAIGVIPQDALLQLGGARAPKVQAVLDAGKLAEKAFDTLDALGKQVVLVARRGQNLDKYGLRYSHLGFAIKGLESNEWGVLHLLTKSDTASSGIYVEGMVNFFSDNPYEMACLIQMLPVSVEEQIFRNWQGLAKKLHCSTYSLTSFPWSLSTQNSNQWVLETIAAASQPEVSIRSEAQDWLKSQGFTSGKLQVGLPAQWAGPLLRDAINFSDQPIESRRLGHIQTVTVESVLDWLQTAPVYERDRPGLATLEIRL